MQTYERRNHKLAKIICVLVMVFCVGMIGLCIYLYTDYLNSRPLIDYPKYTLNPSDWTSGNVIIEVEENPNISEYSFDGGINFQESNRYEVMTNGGFSIVVKDKNGRLSKVIPIAVNKIDKDAPQINFENPTTTTVNSTFNLRNGVIATDGDGSGLSNNYVVTPDTINLSVPGEYNFTYTVFDKVGNYTEKVRTVIVQDVPKGTIYYRYRTATAENYQCEPYLCNCVVTPSSASTNTCPAGYTFQAPDKCCQTCYKTCKKSVWSEWSKWSKNKVTPSATVEVETKVE